MAKGDKHIGKTDVRPNIKSLLERPVIGKKLDLRKKMGTITLVTPPSWFTNQNKSFVLVNLSKRDKDNRYRSCTNRPIRIRYRAS